MLDGIKNIFTLFLPYSCPGCKKPVRQPVCPDCEKSIKYIVEPFCRLCGRQLPPGARSGLGCRECDESPPLFDGARAVFPYTGPVTEIIKRFKFRKNFVMGDYLRTAIGTAINKEKDFFGAFGVPDIIAPVPLHFIRRMGRGFNQSEYLAESVSAVIDVKIVHCIKRGRNTKPQSLLPKEKRIQNIRGAFKVVLPEVVAGRRVLLIDDVMTTGATVNECSRVLKDAGAEAVFVLTAAKGGARQ